MEFISAKDLPITEAEEIDVLCVENGEMKRKPASGLGGNTKYDFVIKAVENWINIDGDDSGSVESVEFLEGAKTYEELKQMYEDSYIPKMLVIGEWCNINENTADGYKEEQRGQEISEATGISIQTWYQKDGETENTAESIVLGNWFRVYPDGTMEWS